jgi:hypothetical protein
MKNSFKAFVVTALMVVSLSAAGDKVKTFTGKGECAKCSLGKTDSCQMALTVKEDGKDTLYLVENNDVSKKFHKNICSDTKDVTVKGTVKEVDGKKVIEAKEIDLAKK